MHKQGTRRDDFRQTDAKAARKISCTWKDFERRRFVDGFVWHEHQDGVTMQLMVQVVHDMTPHYTLQQRCKVPRAAHSKVSDLKMRRLCEDEAAVDADFVDALETKNSWRLPQRYKQLLVESGGGCVSDLDIGFVDSKERFDLLYYQRSYAGRVPHQLLPIGADGGGNLVCLGVSDEVQGKVYYWDHDEEDTDHGASNWNIIQLVDNSFDDFLENLGATDGGLLANEVAEGHQDSLSLAWANGVARFTKNLCRHF